MQISLDIRSKNGNAAGGRGQAVSSQHDNTETLNAILEEGWDLMTMATTFVTTGTVSTEKLTSTGAREEVAGYVLGTYAFTRTAAQH